MDKYSMNSWFFTSASFTYMHVGHCEAKLGYGSNWSPYPREQFLYLNCTHKHYFMPSLFITKCNKVFSKWLASSDILFGQIATFWDMGQYCSNVKKYIQYAHH